MQANGKLDLTNAAISFFCDHHGHGKRSKRLNFERSPAQLITMRPQCQKAEIDANKGIEGMLSLPNTVISMDSSEGGKAGIVDDAIATPAQQSTTAVDPVLMVQAKLTEIQRVISACEYNYTGLMFYAIKKSGGTGHVLSIYKQILTYKLPIQCVEAVFIGSVLSDSLSGVQRFPLCFKSKFQSHMHRHVVLLVHFRGKWGALGISRRSCLMDKPLVYESAAELVEDYHRSYRSVYHRLLTVYFGLPIPHQMEIDQPIVWKALKLRLDSSGLSSTVVGELDSFLTKYLPPLRR